MKKAVHYLLVSMLLALVAYFVVALLFDTPEEGSLERENDMLARELVKIEERTALLEKVVEGLRERDASLYRDIFSTSPPTYIGSSDTARLDVAGLGRLGEADLVRIAGRTLTAMDSTAARTVSQLQDISERLQDKEFRPSSIPSVIPIRHYSLTRTGASVGMKFNPFFKTIRLHEGIDLTAPVGTPVVATADGRVTTVERKAKGFGNRVVITHPGGIQTIYAHLHEIMVSPGQNVRQGSVIGLVGASGRAFAPHLHYEVVKDGRKMEPVHYFFADLNEATYRDMLLMAMTAGQSLD